MVAAGRLHHHGGTVRDYPKVVDAVRTSNIIASPGTGIWSGGAWLAEKLG